MEVEQAQGVGDASGGEAGRGELDASMVLPVLRTHALGAEARDFLGSAMAGGEDYPFVLAMERAEEDLAGAIAHARMSLESARDVAAALGACVAHLHEAGLCHGDLKPLNAVRTAGGAWKLIDLDAAAPLRPQPGFLGLKSSTAYSPPELLYRARQTEAAAKPAGQQQRYRVRAVGDDGKAVDPSQEGAFEPLRAHPSFDMWSFGCLVFELVMRQKARCACLTAHLRHSKPRLSDQTACADARAIGARFPAPRRASVNA